MAKNHQKRHLHADNQNRSLLEAYAVAALNDVKRTYPLLIPPAPNPHPEYPKFTELYQRLSDDSWGVVLWISDNENKIFERYLGLSNERGLVQKQIGTYGLSSAKLRKAGITDRFLFAAMVIHETSHIFGQDGSAWTEDSLDHSETRTFAAQFARMVSIGKISPQDKALRFWFDKRIFDSLSAGLFDKDKDPTYDWIASSMALASVRSVEKFWDARCEKFTDDFKAAIDKIKGPRPLELANSALHRHFYSHTLDDAKLNNPRNALALRDGALLAQQDLRKRGRECLAAGTKSFDSLQAALILRQLARAIDGVYQYADAYYAPYRPIPGSAATVNPASPTG